MKVRAIKTRIFREGENLLSFIETYFPKPAEKAVLVVTSKIVALSENRTAAIADKEKIIKNESQLAIKTPLVWLTIKDNMVMSSAGIDESNADGKLILLPKDSFAQAQKIRRHFMKKYSLKKFGVILTDSRLMPLRAGVVGVALGYAGFSGIKKYQGQPDIFGRKLTMSQVDIADSVATAAVLCMGEGNEQKPLALISDIELSWNNSLNKKELQIDPKNDLYRPLFDHLQK